MLWLLSLMATYVLAQNCDVSTLVKPSQKRRECAKRSGCKWSGRKEVSPGNFIPGNCSGSTDCAALTQNQCKKRNTCYLNWTANGKPCETFDTNANYPCAQLAGKKNYQKCKSRANCINGSGDRQDKSCLDIPADIQTRDCNLSSNRPNKNLCLLATKCTWNIKNKKCVDKPTNVLSCPTINERQACENNHSGCIWQNNACFAVACDQLTERVKCNASKNDCQWFNGFNPDDFDHKKNKEDQKNDPNNASLKENEGTCRAGISRCRDILVENHCKLASTKYGISNCKWNSEAKEMPNAFRCNTVTPCKDHNDSTSCQLANNLENVNSKKCVWQKSGDVMRCMEYACDDSALDTKNKCNTVGCHWHRNKNKRDPNSQGYCGVYDLEKGRRL